MSEVDHSPASVRAARFEVLVAELQSIIRHADPHLAEEELVREAVHHAAYRLSGGSLVASFVG